MAEEAGVRWSVAGVGGSRRPPAEVGGGRSEVVSGEGGDGLGFEKIGGESF